MTDFDHGGHIWEYLFQLAYTDSNIIYIYTYSGKYILVVKYPSAHGVAKSLTRLSDWTELNWTELQVLVCECKTHKRRGFDPWVGKIPRRGKWQIIPVFLPGKFHGQRSLVGYSPGGWKKLDTTEVTWHMHTHIDTYVDMCICIYLCVYIYTHNVCVCWIL